MRKMLVVSGFTSLIACVSAAQDRSEPAPELPPDKSGYHVLNPTPRELWRPLSADRPDATESPYTVDAGAVQVELSFAEYAFQRTSGRSRSMWSVAPMNLKIGLTNNSDLQLLLNPYESASGAGEDHVDGFGDLGLRLKVNLFGNDDGDFAVAILPFISFPTGADGVSSEHVEGGFAIPLAFGLPAEFSLGAQIQFEFVRDDDDEDYETVLSHSLVIGRSIVGDLAGFIEYIGEVTLDGDDSYSPSLGAGLTYAIDGNTQLDFGTIIGLDTPDTESLRLFAGLTVRF